MSSFLCGGASNVAPIGHLLFFAGRPAFANTSLIDADSWLLLRYITCIHAGWHVNAVGWGVCLGCVRACSWAVAGPLSECSLTNQTCSHNLGQRRRGTLHKQLGG